MLAERMSRVSTSPTMKVAGEAAKLKRQGVDVVDFGAGEPDFPTPQPAKDAAKVAIDQNFTKYTPPAGIPDLKQAICARYKTDYGVELHRGGVHRHRRRQAGALQHGDGAVQPGRRSHHARAVLADDSRAGEARRRQAGDRADEAGRRVRDSSGCDHRGHYARGRRRSSSTRRRTRPAR